MVGQGGGPELCTAVSRFVCVGTGTCVGSGVLSDGALSIKLLRPSSVGRSGSRCSVGVVEPEGAVGSDKGPDVDVDAEFGANIDDEPDARVSNLASYLLAAFLGEAILSCRSIMRSG